MGDMELHHQAAVTFAISGDEEANRARNPCHEPNEEDLTMNDAAMGNNGRFWALPYMSNYVSVSAPVFIRELKERIRAENECLLKRYYSSKKLINYAMHRHGSMTSGSDTSAMPNERSKSYVWLHKLMDDSRYMEHLLESETSLELLASGDEGQVRDEGQVLRARAASSYFKYLQKLLAVDLREVEVLKKHNLWIPTLKKQWRNPFSEDVSIDGSLYENKVSPLFIGGVDYISRDYDLYKGSTLIPSLFSEYKLPALVYHCSVEVQGKVFMMGGLMACHKHDDEAPSLKDFVVDGIENLPPPLLSTVVNNPCMVNNCQLYVMSVTSNTLRRPELSGHVPPPLLCMKGCKLTERHIFFYGGFEIRTETRLDDNGNFHLKRRAYMNSTAHILDVLTFSFTKVELTALPYKFFSFPTLPARFGHMQVAVRNTGGSYSNTQRSFDMDDSGVSSPSGGESVDSSEQNLNASSPSVSMASTLARLNTTGHGSGVYSILIFGGYQQSGEDDYEAMNDLWKIDVPVLAKGKRGYFKFGSTANATLIQSPSEVDPWPSPRAFLADCVTDMRTTHNKPDLLERLQRDFIDEDSFPTEEKSKSIFKNLPHARTDNERGKHRMRNKEVIYNGSSNPFAKQRTASPPSASPASLQSVDKASKFDQKVVVIHGGSNKREVFSDMWWFDMETEMWTSVTLHGKSKCGMTPISVGLVGHSLVCVGDMAVCIGGLLQHDVDALFFGKSYNHSKPQLAIGSDFFNIFDLSSQCLLGHTVGGQEDSPILLDDPNLRSRMVLSCGCNVIQSNGDIFLFGGIVSRRCDTRAVHLRGAVLKCVLPSTKLAS
ncbi:related to Guanine nucleotide-binding protein subunit beta 1 [Zygosaccharomyces bailii ISA1307]|nr:related to Guanine nucleotide-binding protein subunit beta 1 [Zygosaccharomyces bailii ISA1307]